MKNIFFMGSCRVHEIPLEFFYKKFKKNDPLGFTHGINEHIQLVRYLNQKIKIPDALRKYIYTFYGGLQKKTDLEELEQRNRELFEQADVVVVEICSLKEYLFDEFYLQKSRFLEYEKWGIERPPHDLMNRSTHSRLDEDTFVHAMDDLVGVLGPGKTLVLTGHVSSAGKASEILDRRLLNSFIKNYCKDKSCFFYEVKSNSKFFNSLILKRDLIHFTIIGRYYAAYILSRVLREIDVV